MAPISKTNTQNNTIINDGMERVTLYVISAIIILNTTTGERIYVSYYPHDEGLSGSRKAQDKFERALWQRTKKVLNSKSPTILLPHDTTLMFMLDEVALCEGKVVVFKANLDVVIYVVGELDQNELLLSCALETIFNSLLELIKPQLDKRAILDNYDSLCLTIAEVIDEGIILETDVNEIVSKLAKPRSNSLSELPLAEQTLSSAFNFARQQFKSFLR